MKLTARTQNALVNNLWDDFVGRRWDKTMEHDLLEKYKTIEDISSWRGFGVAAITEMQRVTGHTPQRTRYQLGKGDSVICPTCGSRVKPERIK